MKELLSYILQLSDNALIHGHRLSEWCGHGPILEQDIALTNTSLDHIGQARSLYQYAADVYNQLPITTKEEIFTSPALLNYANEATEDALAYLRDAWDFKNALLVELPNKDWAYTIAKCFLYDQFMVLFYEALAKSTDAKLAAIAEKSLKEVTYHQKWSSEWVIRLGDGTEDSHNRMQTALTEYWPYIGDLFINLPDEAALINDGVAVDVAALYEKWNQNVKAVLDEATLIIPTETWRQLGGKSGQHTENLGYILAEMQYLQRTYPNAEW